MTGETSDGPSLSRRRGRRRVPFGGSGVGPVAEMRYVWSGLERW